jgi:hypothetical protein
VKTLLLENEELRENRLLRGDVCDILKILFCHLHVRGPQDDVDLLEN